MLVPKLDPLFPALTPCEALRILPTLRDQRPALIVVMTPPPPASTPVEPVELDATALARLRELDPDGRHDVLARVLATFDRSLERMLQQLAVDRSQSNARMVADIAHTLKSSSASVGALRLAQACADVERRLRLHTPGDLQHDIDRLLAEGAAALAAVRAMRKA